MRGTLVVCTGEVCTRHMEWEQIGVGVYLFCCSSAFGLGKPAARVVSSTCGRLGASGAPFVPRGWEQSSTMNGVPLRGSAPASAANVETGMRVGRGRRRSSVVMADEAVLLAQLFAESAKQQDQLKAKKAQLRKVGRRSSTASTSDDSSDSSRSSTTDTTTPRSDSSQTSDRRPPPARSNATYTRRGSSASNASRDRQARLRVGHAAKQHIARVQELSGDLAEVRSEWATEVESLYQLIAKPRVGVGPDQLEEVVECCPPQVRDSYGRVATLLLMTPIGYTHCTDAKPVESRDLKTASQATTWRVGPHGLEVVHTSDATRILRPNHAQSGGPKVGHTRCSRTVFAGCSCRTKEAVRGACAMA